MLDLECVKYVEKGMVKTVQNQHDMYVCDP